jgi:hypothetical protein
MDTLLKLTEREKLTLQIKKEIYNDIYDKVEDISDGKIEPEYYMEEIERELDKINDKLKEPAAPKKEPEKVEVITPDYGPGEEVSHRITDTAILFKVMEVNHSTREYKLTSKNQIKPIKIVVGWGEIDETL